MRKSKSAWIVILLLWGVLILIDQLAKAWALTHLSFEDRLPIFGDFLGLQLTHNAGAAFSFGADKPWIFTILATLVVLAMPLFIRQYQHALPVLALTFIWAGAAGNLGDRLARSSQIGSGKVVDFINYNGWFVGNIADIVLVLGVILFLLWELWKGRRHNFPVLKAKGERQ
ncbi:signal peptidase II [uncultured Arcanobacterium sp.]|uniref:signal peptidase II n=1 Tax=uncultured Arcanobacterium sp. TaxID=487520 RepID=UPI002602015B|nr:signal peptidase II [uncultured Arcanobacterium sp.]